MHILVLEKDRQIYELLESLVTKFNNPDFIELDPISVPHSFIRKEDIEIAGLFSALFAWGNRKTIIQKSMEVLSLMDNNPYDFITNHKETDLRSFLNFKHRTFNATDVLYIIYILQYFYKNYKSLEDVFYEDKSVPFDITYALNNFYSKVFNNDLHPISIRTKKHFAAPNKNSTCKRLNMYLRWMVRKDNQGVDFGLWSSIPTSSLMIPLDVHVEKYAKQFSLLTRKQRDWLAVIELTNKLKQFDDNDPVKYDFALFGLGINHEH